MGSQRTQQSQRQNAGLARRLRAALWGRECGQVLMLTAVMATAFLGLVGLGVDAGLLYAERRQAQNAVDQATLAATRVLFEGGSTSSAIAVAFEYANANGFSAEQVTVHSPPLSGEQVGDPRYLEVIVETQPQTFFIQALMPGGATVSARGVAGFPLRPEPYALVVLDEDDCRAFRQQGNANLAITGGGIMVNSDCSANALSKTGSGDIQADGRIDVHGGSSVSGSGAVSPAPRSVSWTSGDPLASMSPPPLGAPAPGSPGTAAAPVTWTHNSGGDLTVSAGTYYGGFFSNCVCTITLQAGTYVMAGGGFTKAGGANFVGDKVTIYVTENPTNPTGDGEPEPFDLTGSGVLDLRPPTSGPYQGITLWQDAAITEAFDMTGSNDLISGIIYVPGAELSITGDSEFGTVQLIVNLFRLSGNAPLNLSYGEFRVFEAPEVVLVE